MKLVYIQCSVCQYERHKIIYTYEYKYKSNGTHVWFLCVKHVYIWIKKKGIVFQYNIDTMFFRLQITNIINYLTPLKTIRYTVVIHPLQKNNIYINTITPIKIQTTWPLLSFTFSEFLSWQPAFPPLAGSWRSPTWRWIERIYRRSLASDRRMSKICLWIPATERWKESPLPGNRLF